MNRTVRRLPAAVGAFSLAIGVARVGAAAADAPACESARVSKWVSGLDAWGRALEQGEQRARTECRCDRPDTVCVDRAGAPLEDTWPERVTSGQTIVVCAIVPRFDAGKLSVTTAVGTSKFETVLSSGEGSTTSGADEAPCEWSTDDRNAIRSAAQPLLHFAPPLDAAGSESTYWSRATSAELLRDWGPFFDPPATSKASELLAVKSQLVVPDGDVMNVVVRRTERESREATERRYDVTIENGRYYLELALLIPFVYKGVRSIELVPAPGSGDLRVATREDWHVSGAAMIDVFPFGRQRAVGTSFRRCRTRSCVENWLGVQVGAGFGSFLEEWYFGLVLEPVSGLNLAFGTAVLKGDFMPPGRAEGMQLPPGSTIVPAEHYMMRPYLGFSLTLDAVVALDRRSRIGQLF